MIRLQKYLSGAGIASRRKAEELITAGRISVNGKPVTILGSKVDPDKDEVFLDGERIRPPTQPIYLVMHKPRETVCTESDPEGRKRVYDLLPRGRPRLFTIGRLARTASSSGKLLLLSTCTISGANASIGSSAARVSAASRLAGSKRAPGAATTRKPAGASVGTSASPCTTRTSWPVRASAAASKWPYVATPPVGRQSDETSAMRNGWRGNER